MPNRAMIIARKEMREVFRSRVIKYSFIGPAIIFGIVFPLVFGALGSLIAGAPGSGSGGMPFQVPADFFPDITDLGQRTYLALLYTFVTELLLILPVMLPMYIAADSFAGEKERKTIQQLLSTPLKDSEILLGKILTAFIPTIITSYLCVLSTTIILNLLWWQAFGYFRLIFPNLVALVQLLLLYPEMAFFGILAICWVSTRVNKVMEATQVGGVVAVPIIFLLFGSFIGLPVLTFSFALLLVAIFALVDYGLFKLASRRFSRERILTKL